MSTVFWQETFPKTCDLVLCCLTCDVCVPCWWHGYHNTLSFWCIDIRNMPKRMWERWMRKRQKMREWFWDLTWDWWQPEWERERENETWRDRFEKKSFETNLCDTRHGRGFYWCCFVVLFLCLLDLVLCRLIFLDVPMIFWANWSWHLILCSFCFVSFFFWLIWRLQMNEIRLMIDDWWLIDDLISRWERCEMKDEFGWRWRFDWDFFKNFFDDWNENVPEQLQDDFWRELIWEEIFWFFDFALTLMNGT